VLFRVEDHQKPLLAILTKLPTVLRRPGSEDISQFNLPFGTVQVHQVDQAVVNAVHCAFVGIAQPAPSCQQTDFDVFSVVVVVSVEFNHIASYHVYNHP
jgi:hypothetical protein